jgi:hypothetical protein
MRGAVRPQGADGSDLMVDFTADVHLSGPVFDGSARRILEAYTDDVERAVADEGVNMVQAVLGGVLQNPSGYYKSRIQTDRAGDGTVVNDGGVVYGPWLEGVSSRNKSTRFKGYRTFRQVKQRLQARAVGIAERQLKPYLGRLS